MEENLNACWGAYFGGLEFHRRREGISKREETWNFLSTRENKNKHLSWDIQLEHWYWKPKEENQNNWNVSRETPIKRKGNGWNARGRETKEFVLKKRESEKYSHATKQKNVCNKSPKRESESDVNIKVWGSNRRRGSSPICQEGSLRGWQCTWNVFQSNSNIWSY